MSLNKLTISVHFGKKSNYVFLQNFLKSFLICNTYPNIEIILTETSGDKEIRKWLKNLNLNNNFINFEGTKTSIKKNKNTKTKLKLIFPKKIIKGREIPYMRCYINTAYAIDNQNNYFVFLAEDCQFFIKGDVISLLINSLKKIGNDNNHINFCHWTDYRYKKNNNRIEKVININKKLSLFKTSEIKGDIFSLTSRKIYKIVGRIRNPRSWIPNTLSEKLYRGDCIRHLNQKFKANNIKRLYPSIAPVVSFDNDYHEYFKNIIKRETLKNPDYVLCKIISEKEYYKKFKNSKIKLTSAEKIYNMNNWYKLFKTKLFFDNKLKILKNE